MDSPLGERFTTKRPLGEHSAMAPKSSSPKADNGRVTPGPDLRLWGTLGRIYLGVM